MDIPPSYFMKDHTWRNGVVHHVYLYDIYGPTSGTRLIVCEVCKVQAYVADAIVPMRGFVKRHAHA